MAIELFIVPVIGDGTIQDPYRGKYIDGADFTMGPSGAIRYSRADEAIAMIRAGQTYLDSVAAQTDAIRIATAANIDNALTGPQVTAISNFLETRNIPAQMIAIGDTRRQALRKLIGFFLFSQRVEGRTGKGIKQTAVDAGVTLASQYNAMPTGFQNGLLDIAAEFGWTAASLGVNASSTLRQILAAISAAWEDTPFLIAGVSI